MDKNEFRGVLQVLMDPAYCKKWKNYKPESRRHLLQQVDIL